jgi:phosphopantothenoylcysteine decarboxylase / phosphopantothenate---cysteine ligase
MATMSDADHPSTAQDDNRTLGESDASVRRALDIVPLRGKNVVLGVTGSIAAFKAVALASELVKAGALVDVVMTRAAQHFVTPLSFGAITHRSVVTDMFEITSELTIGHVTLGQRADALVVAPASADAIARLALGLADDPLGTTALATRAPLLVAPAMEPTMFAHPATQANLATLRGRGATIVGPAVGRLASGREGAGRMVEPSDIVAALATLLGRQRDFAGKRVVVTAGGTREPIDPVRYIGNRSSGKMGYAIAEAARDRGAEVTLITGPSSLAPPTGVRVVGIESARDLEQAVRSEVTNADVLIMAAAVADYRVERPADQKIKKEDGNNHLTLHLIPNPDILAGLADVNIVKVGFAAETEDLIAHARSKLERKKVDMIVANDVSAPGSGFGTDTNQVVLLTRDGASELPLLPKRAVADHILDKILSLRISHSPTS